MATENVIIMRKCSVSVGFWEVLGFFFLVVVGFGFFFSFLFWFFCLLGGVVSLLGFYVGFWFFGFFLTF